MLIHIYILLICEQVFLKKRKSFILFYIKNTAQKKFLNKLKKLTLLKKRIKKSVTALGSFELC